MLTLNEYMIHTTRIRSEVVFLLNTYIRIAYDEHHYDYVFGCLMYIYGMQCTTSKSVP